MDKNKSYTYIYPMIEDVVNYNNNLIGCYIGDENKPQYNNHIFLRYKFDGSLSSAYMKFEEHIQQCQLLEDFYDIKDNKKNDTVMFVFKIPEKHKEDYQMFLESKYSQISQDYKNEIIKFHGDNHRELLTGILFKTKAYQLQLEDRIGEKIPFGAEFSDVWSKEREYFPKLPNTYSYEELVKDFKHESKND